MNSYKKKRTLGKRLRSVAALLILLAPAVDCDAEDVVKAPVERITIKDAIDAAFAIVKMEPEVRNICRIEKVEINGKFVYRPVESPDHGTKKSKAIRQAKD